MRTDSNLHPPASSLHPTLADCWFLTGPTASGKTSVGVELARRLGAEIISLDSMAIYRGMDVGTAKPTIVEQGGVPHHLIDIVPPTAEFSVSQYLDASSQLAAEIRSRGHAVLFVGGTPLYLKALLRGLDPGPPADWSFRAEVERELADVGIAALHQRLRQVDPLAAAKLHPHDKRRIVRALEVYRATGHPITHRQTHFDESHPPEARRVFPLRWERSDLHRRIEARVDHMFATGLVDEARRLLATHGHLSRTATQAVGYREALAHLAGEIDLPTCIARVKARTRQFARRQETWFRALRECRFVPLSDPLDPLQAVERIVAMATTRDDGP